MGYKTTEYALRRIDLFDRVMFTNSVSTNRFINIYKNCDDYVSSDIFDKEAYIIFERTISLAHDPNSYVCIKIGNKMR